MLQILIEGFTLGITLGTQCLATCTPIYLPFLLSKERSFGENLTLVFQISIGRFVAYILFGLLAGYLGSKIDIFDKEIFGSIAYILLSIYLIYTVFQSKSHAKCTGMKRMMKFKDNPLILGILTGVNLCPSFLIALTRTASLEGPGAGALFFAAFFVGTSLYLIPYIFLTPITNVNFLRKLAKYAAIAIGIYFIYTGVHGLISHSEVPELEEGVSIINIYENHDIYYLYENENDANKLLMNSIKKKSSGAFYPIIIADSVNFMDSVEVKPAGAFYLIDKSASYDTLDINGLKEYSAQNDKILVLLPEISSPQQALETNEFFTKYSFKKMENKGFLWKMD